MIFFFCDFLFRFGFSFLFSPLSHSSHLGSRLLLPPSFSSFFFHILLPLSPSSLRPMLLSTCRLILRPSSPLLLLIQPLPVVRVASDLFLPTVQSGFFTQTPRSRARRGPSCCLKLSAQRFVSTSWRRAMLSFFAILVMSGSSSLDGK